MMLLLMCALSWAQAWTGPTRSCRASRLASRLLSHLTDLPRQGEEQEGHQGISAPPRNQRTMTASSPSKPVGMMGAVKPPNVCLLTYSTAPTSRGWGSVGESLPAECRVNSPTGSASRPAAVLPHTPPRVTCPNYIGGHSM